MTSGAPACLDLSSSGKSLVAERIAGHSSAPRDGRHYDQSRRLNAMREALEDWSTAIDAAADRFRGSGEIAERLAQLSRVVQLRPRAGR